MVYNGIKENNPPECGQFAWKDKQNRNSGSIRNDKNCPIEEESFEFGINSVLISVF